MAVGDKLVTLDGLKAVYQDVNGNIVDLKSAFGEEVVAGTITDGLGPTGDIQGVYVSKATVDGESVLKVYGDCTGSRYFLILNGQNDWKNTSKPFDKTLDKGLYIFETDSSGAQTDYRIKGTYSTFSNEFEIVDQDNKTKVIYFYQPVMIGFHSRKNISYGSEQNPTYISISVKKIVGNDPIARETAETATDKADAADDRFANFPAMLTDDTTAIDANTDLDNLTTPGSYKVASSTRAGQVTNGPTTSTAYRLFVVESIANRIFQIALMNTGSNNAKMAVRFYNGSGWTNWLRFLSEERSLNLTNTIVTSDNYMTYFPNGLLSDAKPNTIWGIYDSSLFADGPIGDEYIGTAGRDGGGIRGTLYTFSQVNDHDSVQTGITQVLVGYRSTSYKPTLSYRIATVSNNTYSWSDWSKFEENGYLHASNTIIYGGNLSGSISDLNDMPSNTIYQIDLNLDGSDDAHTLANHPAPGVSCVVMCYAYSYTSQHGKVQTLYTLDGRMYWRYGYRQAADDYRWTAWKKVTSDLPAIPDGPSSDGTYVLKCTVSSGTKTYSWVSE